MNSPGFSGAPEPGVGSSPEPFDHRLREPVAVAEMVVGVVERRGGVQVEARQHSARPSAAGQQLVVLASHARAARRRRGRTGWRSRAGHRRPARPPSARAHWPRCRRGSPRAPPCPAGTRRERWPARPRRTPSARSPFQVNATVTQRLPLSIVWPRIRRRLHLVEQFGQPRPAAGRRCRRTGTRSAR